MAAKVGVAAAGVKPPAASVAPEVKKQPTAAPAKAAEPVTAAHCTTARLSLCRNSLTRPVPCLQVRQSRNVRPGAPAASGVSSSSATGASGNAAGGMDGGLLSAMEDILEKLKIADYETKFCADR